MKIRLIGYWVATSIAALSFVGGGFLDLVGAEQVASTMQHLGYPAYVAPLLGVWKLLGAVTLLAPRFERLKEWAYAGMFFDLTGASISHAAVGDPLPAVLTPLIMLAVVMASWALRPQNRRLPARTGERVPGERRDAAALQHA